MAQVLCNAVDWGCPYSVRTIQLAGMEITTFLLCLLRHRETGSNIIAGFLAGESSIQRRIQIFCKGVDAHVQTLLSWAQVLHMTFRLVLFVHANK